MIIIWQNIYQRPALNDLLPVLEIKWGGGPTKLKTPRLIGGTSFDGTSDILISHPSAVQIECPTGGEGDYIGFIRMIKNIGYGMSGCSVLVAGLGDFGNNSHGVYLINCSTRGSFSYKIIELVPCPQYYNGYDSMPGFIWWEDSSYYYIGARRHTYNYPLEVVVLESEPTTLVQLQYKKTSPPSNFHWILSSEIQRFAKGSIYSSDGIYNGLKAGTSLGTDSIAWGFNNEVSVERSFAYGVDNVIKATNSSRCPNNQINGTGNSIIDTADSSCSGTNNTIKIDASIYPNGNPSANNSHVEGFGNTLVNAFGSHMEGSSNNLPGTQQSVDTHVEGAHNTLTGNQSHIEGRENTLSGIYSHVGGYKNKVVQDSITVIGKYCKEVNGLVFSFDAADSTQQGDALIIGNGTSSARSNAMRVTHQGDIYATKAMQSSGADYAEFIKEWEDGNPNNEDRVGYFVTIRNKKIRIAQEGDYIAGIISGNPSVVGNSDEDYYWKYERDAFNRIILEDVPEMEQEMDELGNPILDEEGNPILHPTGNILKNARMKVSETYNVEKQQYYIERKLRKEWDYVGMVGVIPTRDDGTCLPDHFCKCGKNGVATLATERGFDTFYVIERINDHVISVLIK